MSTLLSDKYPCKHRVQNIGGFTFGAEWDGHGYWVCQASPAAWECASDLASLGDLQVRHLGPGAYGAVRYYLQPGRGHQVAAGEWEAVRPFWPLG